MSHFITDYTLAMTNYEKQLDILYKKNNGIFYTDLSLASLMVEEVGVSEVSTVLDPCCGTGSFILSSIAKGVKKIFGADQDEKAIDVCNFYAIQANTKVIDTIGNSGKTTLKKLNTGGKVDFVIGNPPYTPLNGNACIKAKDYVFLRKVSDSGNNLFVAALLRAFEFAKQGGIISYIVPKNFLHVNSYNLLRREVLREKTIMSITDIGAYFKNVRGEQIILTIKNSTPSNNVIQVKKMVDNTFINLSSVPQSFFKNEILLFNSEYELSIYKKMKASYQTLKDVCNGYIGRGRAKDKNAVAGKDIRKFGYKNISLPKNGNRILIQNIYSSESGIIAAFGGKLDAGETVTVFTDSDEKMCRYILGVLHSRLCNFFLYKFCYNNSKLTMHTDSKYLKKIPLSVKNDASFGRVIDVVCKLEKTSYMTNKWLDLLETLNTCIYEAYGITQSEADFIDSEMKHIQSKKWVRNG